MDRPIWEGIYDSFDSVPKIGNGFDGDVWIERNIVKLKNLIQSLESHSEFTTINFSNASPLLLLLALNYAGKPAEILDVGGGFGDMYIKILNSSQFLNDLNYTVLEKKPVCLSAKAILKHYEKIFFIDALPESAKFDVVHIGSSLQYVDDWVSLMNKMFAFDVDYFVFTDFPAGSNMEFITGQNYYDSILPFRFFRLDSFLKFMDERGYALIHSTAYLANILGSHTSYQMENFEPELRLNYSKNLVFKKALY